jgi:PAS domain S-box-containing protein
MLGWRSDELLGRVFHDSVHYRQVEGTPCRIEECVMLAAFRSGELVREHEDVFLQKNGESADVICSNTPIVQEGWLTGAVVVVNDITASKKDGTRTTPAGGAVSQDF